MSLLRSSRPALVAVLAIGAALGGLLVARHALQPDLRMRPVFALQDLDGVTQSVTQWDGRPLIVNFWATWCAPCRREIPLLKALQEEYADQGVQIIGIAILDELEAIRDYAGEMEITYPLLVGEQDALDAVTGYGIDNLMLPLTAFTDREGRVVALHSGELYRDQAIELIGKTL